METYIQVSWLIISGLTTFYGVWILLFRSESPSQVFVIVIQWLLRILENVPVQEWSDVVISYDNMCHLDSMRVAQNPLPLPQPYDHMWLSVTKVHLHNVYSVSKMMFLLIYRLLMISISKTTKMKSAVLSMHLAKSKNWMIIKAWILWVQSKYLHGCHAINAFCVQCQKLITFFTCINLWREETSIQSFVISSTESLYYQKLHHLQ